MNVIVPPIAGDVEPSVSVAVSFSLTPTLPPSPGLVSIVGFDLAAAQTWLRLNCVAGPVMSAELPAVIRSVSV